MPARGGADIVRVLVTGGAGFLGGHLRACLRREGIDVRVLDRVAGEEEAGAAGAAGAGDVRSDVRDRGALERAMAGVDAVVHAAFASPQQSLEVIRSVNAGGTAAVCAAALAGGARRLVLVSSTIVTWPPRPHPLLRSSPLGRLDAYRASRVEAEAIASQHAGRGLSVAIVRPKTFIGPGRVGAFALVFEAVRRGHTVLVLGHGRNRYQLLDVRDLADAVRRLAGDEATGTFSLGAREFGTVATDLQSLLDHARSGARLRLVRGGWTRAALRAVELAGLPPLSEWHQACARGRDSIVDTSAAEARLGWRPRRSNAEALIDAYDWYAARVAAAGSAPTTHPVPLAHRLLAAGARLLPR